MSYLQFRTNKGEQLLVMLLLLIVVTMLLPITLNSISIILFCALTLVFFVVDERWKQISKLQWLFMSFYGVHLLGVLYSADTRNAAFELEKKLSILLFPLLLGSFRFQEKQLNKILLTYIVMCLCMVLYFVLYAYAINSITSSNTYFFGGNLSGPLHIHRVYFAMYLLLGILICVHFFTLYSDVFTRVALVVVGLLFLFIILLLEARMAIITVGFLVLLGVVYLIWIKKNLLLGCALLLICFFGLWVLFVNNQSFNNKISELTHDLDKGNSRRNSSSVNIRIIKWQCAYEVLKENLPWGTGSGDVTHDLVEKYKQKEFYWGIKDKYNAHNQFLETGIGLGIMGMIVLLLSFIVPLYYSIKQKKYLYTGFIFIFAMSCMTESMLCAQKGVVFYAFFNSLLAFHYLDVPSKT